MRQREVQDDNNVRWQCVQALAGVAERSDAKAEEIAGNNNGKVEVVCTPSGGAQTIRLQLDPSWEEKVSDEDLLREIKKTRPGNQSQAIL